MRCKQWGLDLSRNAIAMTHTKLQLDVNNTSEELELVLQELEGMQNLDFDYIKNSEAGSRYTTKGPEQIIEDYLEKVLGCCLNAVDWMMLSRMPVTIVATVPVVAFSNPIQLILIANNEIRNGVTVQRTLSFEHSPEQALTKVHSRS
jgi:hypothetical protein